MSAPAELRIRLARPEEHEQLEALQRRASLALQDYRAQLEAEPDALSLPPEHVAHGGAFVAELDGRVAGFAVVLASGGHAELDGLFVEPELWRRGIGEALVAVALREARRQGLAMMVTASPAVRTFYEKCGFAIEGEVDTKFGVALRMSSLPRLDPGQLQQS